MERRRIRVADVKQILVQWDGGGSIREIAQRLGYSRPTVRKYVQAGQRVGLVRGSRRIDEIGWERAARAAITQVAAEPRVGVATADHRFLLLAGAERPITEHGSRFGGLFLSRSR